MTFYLKRPILSRKLSIRVDPLKIVSKKKKILLLKYYLAYAVGKTKLEKIGILQKMKKIKERCR